MKTKILFAAVALTALAACSRTPPELELANDAATALGGVERVTAVSSLILEGEGTQYNLGQDLRPDANGQTFSITDYKRTIDVANGRARTEQTRTPNFAYFAGRAPQRLVQGIDGAVGYDVAPNGNATRAPDAVVADRRAEFFHHPVVAVRAALDPAAVRTNLRTEGTETLLDVTAQNQAFTLAVDSTTKLPTRVVTREYNVNLGDVVITTSFDGYQDVGGLQLPGTLTWRTDDFTMGEIRLANQVVDGAIEDLAAPAAAASAAPVSGPPPANVVEEQLAPGVWFLGGQSHNSVLVEFNDHGLLIEVPLHDTRSLGVIAKARELLAGKPLTQLVNSHHHFDHSGGIRAAIAEGLTIITHEGNADHYRRVAERSHTIVQDRLAQAPQPLKIETVSDEMTITDGSMTVVLYPVTSEHSETMLMAYLPRERLLVEADMYTPGRTVLAFAAKFLEDLKARNLRIDRIAPLHGVVVPYAQFEKEATSTPAG